MTSIQKIAVLGGGISGLSTAYYAAKKFPQAKITLYEKEAKIGGALQSIEHNNFVYDLGPRSLKTSKSLDSVLKIAEEAEILEECTISYTSFIKIYHIIN